MSGFYHLNVRIISRGSGRSAVACAAYRSGETLTDERYGKVHDYRPRQGIEANGIMAPANAPAWMLERERLWNGVEAAEKRKDARLSREFEVAFPHQFDMEQRQELLRRFIAQEITSRGLVADWAIHAPNRAGDQRNWHAHVMTTTRTVGPNGFETIKDRSLNTPEQLTAWRASWAELQNEAFKRNGILGADGHPLTVDHRSYEARGIELEPTVHMGVHATAMERRGITSDIGALNQSIRRANDNDGLVPPEEEERRQIQKALLHRTHRRNGTSHVPEP